MRLRTCEHSVTRSASVSARYCGSIGFDHLPKPLVYLIKVVPIVSITLTNINTRHLEHE